MADFHVLNINDKKDTARVAFHFAAPAGNNQANVAYSTAYKQWREEGGVTLASGVPGLATDDPTEASAIAAGTVLEHIESVQFSANATNNQKLAVIQGRWTTLNGTIPTRVSENLRFWGYDGDVP